MLAATKTSHPRQKKKIGKCLQKFPRYLFVVHSLGASSSFGVGGCLDRNGTDAGEPNFLDETTAMM